MFLSPASSKTARATSRSVHELRESPKAIRKVRISALIVGGLPFEFTLVSRTRTWDVHAIALMDRSA